MPKYLLQVNYTQQGIKGLLAEGGSARKAAAEEVIKSAGGTIDSFYYALGKTDLYIVADLPNNAGSPRRR